MAIEYSETTDSGYDVMNDVNKDLTIPGIEKMKFSENAESSGYSIDNPKHISTLKDNYFITSDDLKNAILKNPEYNVYRKMDSQNNTIVDKVALESLIPQSQEEAYKNLIDETALQNNMTSLNPNGPLKDFIKGGGMTPIDAYILQKSIWTIVYDRKNDATKEKADEYLNTFITQFGYFICSRADLLGKSNDNKLGINKAYWDPLQTMYNILYRDSAPLGNSSKTRKTLEWLEEFLKYPNDFKGVETNGSNKNGSNIFKKYCYDLLPHEIKNS